MMEEELEALVRIWNRRPPSPGQGVDFLDSPNMSQAGTLSDLVEDLAEWLPEEGMMEERLQDGAATEEIRDTMRPGHAVQSATGDLAEVAGDAALAYRREKPSSAKSGRCLN